MITPVIQQEVMKRTDINIFIWKLRLSFDTMSSLLHFALPSYLQIEARILLAKLLQNFRFSLVPKQNLGYIVETTLKPKDGCQVFITPA